MIDISRETLLSLDDAAKHSPGLLPGRNVNAETMRRWATRGMRGVTLETLIAGGRRCTSLPAVQRFFERLTEARDRDRIPPARRQERMKAERTQKDLREIHKLEY